MDEELKGVHEHMRALGLGALTHANWHANYHSMDNPYWSELSVLQAAHAAEILIKARIAQEHPLLIFDQLPKPETQSQSSLALSHLIENGRTFQFSELPNRLWATTGITLPNIEQYQAFGRLRNSIQHFTIPDRDVAADTINFIYGVIDRFIHQCWGLYAIDFNEDHEPYVYLVSGLIRRGITFLVSPEMLQNIEYIEFDWPQDSKCYRQEMEARIEKAKQLVSAK